MIHYMSSFLGLSVVVGDGTDSCVQSGPHIMHLGSDVELVGSFYHFPAGSLALHGRGSSDPSLLLVFLRTISVLMHGMLDNAAEEPSALQCLLLFERFQE